MHTTGRLILDEYTAKVVEFMERELPGDRLLQTAKHLPLLANVLWSAESCGSLEYDPIRAQQPTASGSGPAAVCAGDDSAAASGFPS